MVSCARGTRTIGMCSFDARTSETDQAILLWEEARKLGTNILLIDRIEDVVVALALRIEAWFGPSRSGTEEE